MPTTDRKSNKDIRFNSGNNFYVKLGTGDWENLGKLVSGKLSRKTDIASVELADGETVQKRGKRLCTLQITLAQMSAAILNRLDELESQPLKAYYDNGFSDGTYMEFYMPDIEIVENFDVDMKGSSHQAIALDCIIQPQSSVVTCTPSTDLPSVAHATGSTLITGKNVYYLPIDTTIP